MTVLQSILPPSEEYFMQTSKLIEQRVWFPVNVFKMLSGKSTWGVYCWYSPEERSPPVNRIVETSGNTKEIGGTPFKIKAITLPEHME